MGLTVKLHQTYIYAKHLILFYYSRLIKLTFSVTKKIQIKHINCMILTAKLYRLLMIKLAFMFKCFFGILLVISFDVNARYKKEITCATAVFEPYTIKSATENRGIDTDILNALAKKINWKITYQYYPWARLIALAKTGRIDCLFSAAFEIERTQYLDYTTTPLHITRYYVFAKKSKLISTLKSLQKKIIGIHRGYVFPEPLASMVVKGELSAIEAKTEKELFQMLNLGRIDAVLTDKAVGDFYSEDVKNIISFPLKHSGLSAYLTFKKGFLMSEELAQINIIISDLINDKVLMSKIYKNY